MTDFNKLIPEMRLWNDGKGIDVGSWIDCCGRFPLAVGYSTVFWPGFTLFEDYVLRAQFSVEALRGFESQCGGDRESIEAAMNHFHIADLHNAPESPSREQILYLGHVLRDIYRAKLAWDFPERKFEVVLDDDDAGALVEYQLTFFQIR